MPTKWTQLCAEKCWVVMSPDKNMDDEKQTETQWAKNWSTPLEEKLSLLTAFQLVKQPFHSPTWWKLFPWNNISQLLSDLVFSTSDLWVKSVHTSPTKLQAVWFCQSLTTTVTFSQECPQNRLNIYRQCKMLLQELSWNAKIPDHITPILRQLHWLPIQKRICHKILSATYQSVHDNTPLSLSDLLQKHYPSHLLRSASRSLLEVPRPRESKTKWYSQRAFRYVAPSLCNVHPESIKDSIQSFRPLLKTHVFT